MVLKQRNRPFLQSRGGTEYERIAAGACHGSDVDGCSAVCFLPAARNAHNLHPANAEELANIAQETGAEVLRGALRYPSETGGCQVGNVDLSEHLGKYRDCEVLPGKTGDARGAVQRGGGDLGVWERVSEGRYELIAEGPANRSAGPLSLRSRWSAGQAAHQGIK